MPCRHPPPLDRPACLPLGVQGRTLQEIDTDAEVAALHRLLHHEIQHIGPEDVRVETLQDTLLEDAVDLLR